MDMRARPFATLDLRNERLWDFGLCCQLSLTHSSPLTQSLDSLTNAIRLHMLRPLSSKKYSEKK
jgi:hypothetical protein